MMKIPVPASRLPSILRRMRASIFIAAACLAQPVTAADENNPMTSTDDVIPDTAMQQDKPGSGNLVENREEPIEEIIVTGQRIILSLRLQIIQAEDRVFELFNELNDDDMYDIHCTMEAPIGSNIKRRMCLPNYYHRATADNANEYLGLVTGYSNVSVPSPPAKLAAAHRYPTLREKVREFARKSPELLDALRVNYELNEELKKKRNAYHGIGDE